MYNAHDINQFNSEILSDYFEPLQFEVKENGTVIWYCCDNAFENRLVLKLYNKKNL